MPFDFEHRARARLAKEGQLKVGLVGFGTFGQFLAKRLVEAGHKVGSSLLHAASCPGLCPHEAGEGDPGLPAHLGTASLMSCALPDISNLYGCWMLPLGLVSGFGSWGPFSLHVHTSPLPLPPPPFSLSLSSLPSVRVRASLFVRTRAFSLIFFL